MRALDDYPSHPQRELYNTMLNRSCCHHRTDLVINICRNLREGNLHHGNTKFKLLRCFSRTFDLLWQRRLLVQSPPNIAMESGNTHQRLTELRDADVRYGFLRRASSLLQASNARACQYNPLHGIEHASKSGCGPTTSDEPSL